MKIIWTPQAEQDRVAIWDYFVDRDPAAAVRINRLFSDAVSRLADFPTLGHVGTVVGTRELTPHRRVHRLARGVAGCSCAGAGRQAD